MRFADFLRSKLVSLCFLGMGMLVLLLFLLYLQTAPALLLFLLLFFFLLCAGWLCCGYFFTWHRLKRLTETLRALPEKHLVGELLPAPWDPVERQYFEVMQTVSHASITAVEQAVREKEQYRDYVELWIHELKTPLTACSLILANGGDAHKLRRELKRADNLTETILYAARLRTAEKDLQIAPVQAGAVAHEAVKSQMELLTAAGIGVELQGDFPLHTDGKVLCFILKQLLINCAKYCPSCKIQIKAENGCISVEDNGPGIPSHELRRVCERGFTGKAGRENASSTGMGLYLVRSLTQSLNAKLDVQSKEGEFTRITLSFPNLTKT